jgi:drug/metabolite transporter (DMT)-like permease
METIHIVAALLSAVLHASWNAAVKGSERPTDAMTGQMVVSAVVMTPVLLWTGMPAMVSWLWIALSTFINLYTVKALLRAYELAGFGVVYPTGRAVSVMLVVPLSTWVAGDQLPGPMLWGIGLIVSALVLVAASSRRDKQFDPRAIGWTLLAGFGIALYVMADARGVRVSGSALAYCALVSISNGVAMAWRQRHRGHPWLTVRENARVSVPAGVASAVSYLLILWVWSQAPIAPSAALRDTSAVFAILISVVWLKEKFDRWRLAAVLMAAAAVPIMRLA